MALSSVVRIVACALPGTDARHPTGGNLSRLCRDDVRLRYRFVRLLNKCPRGLCENEFATLGRDARMRTRLSTAHRRLSKALIAPLLAALCAQGWAAEESSCTA